VEQDQMKKATATIQTPKVKLSEIGRFTKTEKNLQCKTYLRFSPRNYSKELQ